MLSPQSSDVTLLTPELAAHWRYELQYKKIRTIKEVPLERMCDLQRRGLFPKTTTAIHATLGGRDNRLLDGVHRSEMVIRTGIALELTRLQLDAETELQREFEWDLIDQGSKRTFPDSLSGETFDGYENKSQVRAVGQTYEFIRAKLSAQSFERTVAAAHADRKAFAREMVEPGMAFFRALEVKGRQGGTLPRTLFLRKQVMAILLPEFQADPERMAALIRSVHLNDSLVPRTAAHRFAQEVQAKIGTQYGDVGKGLEVTKRLAYCLRAHLLGLSCISVPRYFGEQTVTLPGSGFILGWRSKREE